MLLAKSNPGIAAIEELTCIGYRFTVEGDTILARYLGFGNPDPAQVQPLLDLIKQYKSEVLSFLKCYCPKSGKVCFGTLDNGDDSCIVCHWANLKALNPGLALMH
ncbi:MAG: hypothetical protein ACYDIC_18210 [Desulfobaccales bacterium]